MSKGKEEINKEKKPNKLWHFIKTKFLSRDFLSFVIIGCMNTAINFFVMKGMLKLFDVLSTRDISTPEAGGFMYYISMGSSTLVAFICASLFSYFANAHFTYRQNERDTKTFGEAIIAYVLRFAMAYLFTLLIWWLILAIFQLSSDPTGWLRTIANLIASALMIPPFYLVLGLIFKRTRSRLEAKKKEEDNKADGTPQNNA